MNVVHAVIAFTSIGAACAIILVLASKFMAVKVDERIARLSEALPGANCGACGFSGCDAYAHALVYSSAPPNACPPGGASTMRAISEILGIDGAEMIVERPVIYCSGDKLARQLKMDYAGIETCIAAKQLFGGRNACAYGCIGFGDCLAACASEALCLDSGLPQLDQDKCTGCKLCAKACPNGIIVMEEAGKAAVVACLNTEKGAVVRKKCSSGCIACTKCVKECPKGAIEMADNLARINREKCDGCGKCVDVCIAKCIKMIAPHPAA